MKLKEDEPQRLFVGKILTQTMRAEYLVSVYAEGATIAYRPEGEDRWGPEAELEERDAR